MTNLGSRGRFMRLQCKPCGWIPPVGLAMEGVQLHFQVEHDQDEVTLDLVAACSCGAAMTVTDTRPDTPGQVKDYLECGACGNTGHVRREAQPGTEVK
jgi:rubredoxin